MPNIAIIGAGLSALTLAEELKNRAEITIFEKSRGVGGRMSTRYADSYKFDHGAQFFTARSEAFQRFLRKAEKDDVIKPWSPRIFHVNSDGHSSSYIWDEPHYVASPQMNSFCKYLAAGKNVQTNTRVADIKQQRLGWALFDGYSQPLGIYDWVISTAPAAQSYELFGEVSSSFKSLQSINMHPCFAVMIGFENGVDCAFDVAIIEGQDIAWVANNTSKPERKGPKAYVVHSSAPFAEKHQNMNIQQVQDLLIGTASSLLDIPFAEASYKNIHFWRYARVEEQSPADLYCIDQDLRLAVCGDGFISGRVESAFISAFECALALKEHL